MSGMQTQSPFDTVGFAHPRSNVNVLGIEGGMKVADFGSGSGAHTLAIAERLGPTGKVYAIEVQRDLLRRISNEAKQRRMQNVEVIWADLEEPRASKLAGNSMDVVLISNLLFQVPDKAPVLREARRIIRQTGHVAIIDWSDPALSRSEGSRIGPRKEDIVSKEMATTLAEGAGLELAREFPAGRHHWGLIFRPAASSPL